MCFPAKTPHRDVRWWCSALHQLCAALCFVHELCASSFVHLLCALCRISICPCSCALCAALCSAKSMHRDHVLCRFPLKTHLVTRALDSLERPRRTYYVSDSIRQALMLDETESLKVTSTGLKVCRSAACARVKRP